MAMVASQKIGQSEAGVGGLRRGGGWVGICHYSRVRSLPEVMGCAGNPVEVIEPLVMRRGHLNEITGTTRLTMRASLSASAIGSGSLERSDSWPELRGGEDQ
jgi:hypothetical protein